jgi:hypothetical protein
MKTTDATVLDEPKTHVRGTEETIEPAIESRPRPTTGVREAKIYIDGKFYSEANAKVYGVRPWFVSMAMEFS